VGWTSGDSMHMRKPDRLNAQQSAPHRASDQQGKRGLPTNQAHLTHLAHLANSATQR